MLPIIRIPTKKKIPDIETLGSDDLLLLRRTGLKALSGFCFLFNFSRVIQPLKFVVLYVPTVPLLLLLYVILVLPPLLLTAVVMFRVLLLNVVVLRTPLLLVRDVLLYATS